MKHRRTPPAQCCARFAAVSPQSARPTLHCRRWCIWRPILRLTRRLRWSRMSPTTLHSHGGGGRGLGQGLTQAGDCRTALKDHQPPTANRRQPPTIVQRCFCGLGSCPCLSLTTKIELLKDSLAQPPQPPGQSMGRPLSSLPSGRRTCGPAGRGTRGIDTGVGAAPGPCGIMRLQAARPSLTVPVAFPVAGRSGSASEPTDRQACPGTWPANAPNGRPPFTGRGVPTEMRGSGDPPFCGDLAVKETLAANGF